MAKLLNVSILFLLLSTSSAYFRPTECGQITYQIETDLLKMSLEFSSLAYFMNGYRDLQEAWGLFPSWLMNCIPFIVDPNLDSFNPFEKIDSQLLESALWANQLYFTKHLRTDLKTFQDCREVLYFFYQQIMLIKDHADTENYLGMVLVMREIGTAGKPASMVCGKNRE